MDFMHAASIVFAIVLLGIGLLCLIWPLKIQQLALTSPWVYRGNPWHEWMKTTSYLVSLRISGAIAILMCITLLCALIFGR